MTTMTKAGRYEIVGELGRGAMGVVYRATDPVIGRSVAVKTIRLTEEGTGLSRQELLSRFQTEARAAGLLTHPNIVVVYDAGEEDGLYYITMELVEGKSLQALLDGGHAFPVPRVLRILEQTCSALHFAHERNIVHRDIKPANLMLTADDTVKVTDFGTAKILQFGTVQQTTHVMGTPSYMSPEQVKGRPIDGRTDIFSLGVVMYEMLTGEKPFPGQSITTVIYKIVNEDPIPPRQLNPSLHPGLNEIVMRALAKEPEARYQSCRELLEDLRNYRALGANEGNPDATLVTPRQGAGPFSTPTTPLRTPYFEPSAAATVQSLQNRAGTPQQTPTVRRTGSLPPFQEPKKKNNPFATIFAAIFLVAVIVWGGIRLRPEFQAARERNKISRVEAAPLPSTEPTSTSTDTPASAENHVSPPATSAAQATDAPKSAVVEDPASSNPPVDPPAKPPVVAKKTEPAISSAAADYKHQIEDAIREKELTGRVKVNAVANTLTITGKLRPAEHASLLKFMRNAPTNVRVVDDIQYDDTPVATTEQGDNGAHPVPAAGRSAIHVVTDVLGATATLYGPAGRMLFDCQTPCSFNNLAPARYSLQVQKEGYLSLQTAFEAKPGQTLDQKLHLEALAKGLYLSSRPAGADIFINGAKQSGQTPTTLPLAAGQYDLVLRMPGYDPYAGHIQVKDNIQTTLDVELKVKQQAHVAWAQVNSTPQGAEIFVDGAPTGQVTPARVQVPSGSHIIA
ncbi:MAG TPA: serine/threonine-protein kinase, partial [Candidatus Sulfotelmatobacter sp.]|nr:serine/threonine-protein kinase [Candidatus Sulfotelmatobacter sp.]